jgi:hypothetical protein
VRISDPAFLVVYQRENAQQFNAIIIAHIKYIKRNKVNKITTSLCAVLQPFLLKP